MMHDRGASASTNTRMSELNEDVETKASEHRKGHGRERGDGRGVDFYDYA